MKKSSFKRFISSIVAAALTISLLAPAQSDVHAQTTVSNKPYLEADSIFAEEDGELQIVADEEELAIVGEDISARSLYAKDFMLERNMHLAAIYPEAVHYEKDGKLEDIDNSLKLTTGDDGQKQYVNKANSVQMVLPASIRDGEMRVAYKEDALSFSLIGSFPGEKEVSHENWNTVQKAEAEISNDYFSKEDLAQMTERMQAILPKHLSSSAFYKEVFPGMDACYSLSSTGIKENITIKEWQEDSLSFCYTVNAGAQILKLQEDGSILAYDEKGEETFGITVPYARDSEDDLCFDIDVKLEEGSWDSDLGKTAKQENENYPETAIMGESVDSADTTADNALRRTFS